MCKRLSVFIQNLKDTTTVLQQLEVCINALKDGLKVIDNADEIIKGYEETLANLNTAIDNIEVVVAGINSRVTTLEQEMPDKLYKHRVHIDDGSADWYFVIIDNSNELITVDTIKSNMSKVINSYGVLYDGNDQLIYDIKLVSDNIIGYYDNSGTGTAITLLLGSIETFEDACLPL